MEVLMNKTEFLKAVAEKADLTQKQAGAVYDAVFEVVKEALKGEEKIQLPGFVSVQLKHKPAREGINPATKQKVKIAARKVPEIKFGKAFKDLF